MISLRFSEDIRRIHRRVRSWESWEVPPRAPVDGMQVSRQTSMRGDRYRQCPPRGWDLCPIPKISDIFAGRRRSVHHERATSTSFSLPSFFSVLSLLSFLHTSSPADDEFVRPMPVQHLRKSIYRRHETRFHGKPLSPVNISAVPCMEFSKPRWNS